LIPTLYAQEQRGDWVNSEIPGLESIHASEKSPTVELRGWDLRVEAEITMAA
jgi:hypothetical protein